MKKTAVAILLLTFVLTALTGCAGPKSAPLPGDAYGERAHRHFLSGEMPKAIDSYGRAFAAARRADNLPRAAQALSNIGRAYYEMERPDSATLYLAKAYEEFTLLKNGALAGRAAAFLALNFANAGDGAQAQYWFNAAASSAGNSGDKRTGEHYLAVIRAMVDFRISSQIGNEQALGSALAFYRKKKDHTFLSTIYVLMADAERSKGDCASASRYLHDALASADKSGEMYKRSRALLRLSAINFCTGDEGAGKRYYARALDTAPRGVELPPVDEVASCSRACR